MGSPKVVCDPHFRNDQAESHRQDDQKRRSPIGENLDNEILRRFGAQRDEVDHSAGHSEQEYAGDQ